MKVEGYGATTLLGLVISTVACLFDPLFGAEDDDNDNEDLASWG